MYKLKIVLVKEKMLATGRQPLRANNGNYIKEKTFEFSFFPFGKK